MTPEEFDGAFDSFRTSAFRLETLESYDVGGAEVARLKAFRTGEPMPERSPRTTPWLARIARTSANGKHWTRVRIVDEPPSEYQRYQLNHSYLEATEAGDRTLIVPRSAVRDFRTPDFWLFDADTPDAKVIVMSYDAQGHWLDAELLTDLSAVARFEWVADRMLELAIPLEDYLASARHG